SPVSGDRDVLVGLVALPLADLTIGPLHPNLSPPGPAEAAMGRTELSTGVPSADHDLSFHEMGTEPDLDPGTDRIGVGAVLSQRHSEPAAGLSSDVVPYPGGPSSIHDHDVQAAVAVEVDHGTASAAFHVQEPRLGGRLDEGAVGLAEKEVVGVAGGGLRHLLYVALGDEEVHEAVVVDVLELGMPGGRRPGGVADERTVGVDA